MTTVTAEDLRPGMVVINEHDERLTVVSTDGDHKSIGIEYAVADQDTEGVPQAHLYVSMANQTPITIASLG